MAGIKPLIPWPGGQSRDVKLLHNSMPDHEVYVEPFAGGASLFFEKPMSPVEVLNDTSTWLMDFYEDVRRGGARKCGTGLTYSKSNYERALAKVKANKKITACDRMVLSAMGFDGGQQISFSTSRHKAGKAYGTKIWEGKLDKLPIYEHRLKHAHLMKVDFAVAMRKYDGPDTFHFLDPPWPVKSAKKYYEGNIGVTVEKVAKVAKSMKGKVWVIYNYDKKIAQIMRKHGLKLYKIKTQRTAGTKGSVYYEKLVATNYDIKTGKRR